jgi:hypothetical protein
MRAILAHRPAVRGVKGARAAESSAKRSNSSTFQYERPKYGDLVGFKRVLPWLQQWCLMTIRCASRSLLMMEVERLATNFAQAMKLSLGI